MTINCYRPTFTAEMKRKAKLCLVKGGKVSLEDNGEATIATVRAYGRLVGKMAIFRDKSEAWSIGAHVIEKDYYPVEAIVLKLVPFLKKKKVRTLEV